MKNIERKSAITGLSLFALGLMAIVPAATAQQGDTVSAIGVPSAPGDAPSVNGKFPPQPIGVAPTEEAAPPVASDNGASSGAAATPAPASAAPGAPVANAPAQPAAPLAPLPQETQGNVVGTNVMGDNGAKEKHSGTYYDSNALVPDRDLAAAGAVGPRTVDPAYEPGQRFVVVEKGASASSYEGQVVAATRALKLGRYAAAMEMFEKLYRKNSKDQRVLMGLAVAQQGAGFKESAARTYEDLLKVQPNNADAIVNLMGLMKDQYPSVTLKKLGELQGKYPSNPGIPAQMALINAQEKNYDDAIRYFEMASSMDPTNPSHVYNMAIVTDQKGDVSKAIKLYEQALQMDATYGDIANALPREQIYDRLVVLRRKV